MNRTVIKVRNGVSCRVHKKVTRQQILVADLTVGMHVVELDRAWEDSPFLFQGFLLEDEFDIQMVQDLCQWVYVEVVEERWQAIDKPSQTPIKTVSRFVEKREMAEQLTQANRTYRSAKLHVKELFASAHLGQAMNLKAAQNTVKECVNRVIDNPNAMLWLTRLKHHDEYTVEHSVNVCLLAIALGQQVDLAPYELENLGMCGLMHDIGKMKVPSDILNKSGRLTPEEFAEMARHTIYAKQLLMGRSDVYPGAVDVAYNHHERLDGKGYPRGLDSTKLSQFTRIVTIVDAYDAMTSDRCYKRGMSSLDAMRILNKNRGTQFDDALVRKFITMIGMYPPGYLLEMGNGEVGIILSADTHFQLKPRVILVLDSNKQPQPERIVNLAHDPLDDRGQVYTPIGVYRSGAFGVNVAEYINRGLRIQGSDAL